MPRRRDHLTTWLIAVPALVYGLIATSAFFPLLTPSPMSIGYAFAVIPGIAALYAGAAILQVEYSFARSWRPTWRQGLTVAWVGGWLLLAAGRAIRAFRNGGMSEVAESLGIWVFLLGLFVVLPWILASLRARPRR